MDFDEMEQLPQHYYPEVRRARVILLALGILYTYRLPSVMGEIGNMLFSFAIPTFYILSGYLVLRKSRETGKRILRAIGRTAICFVILAAVYLLLSLLADRAETLSLLGQKSFWVDFLLLNVWGLPLGASIWYVQALLYAYIIIYILYKCRLLRFDIVIAAVCLALAFFVGECAVPVGFHFLGHDYLGGNFLTRALPYLLLGGFLHRKKAFFERMSRKTYALIAAFGMVLGLVEFAVFTGTDRVIYFGHVLGTTFVAVAITLFVIFTETRSMWNEGIESLSRYELMIPYYVCAPVYYVLTQFFINNFENKAHYFTELTGLMTVFFSFLLLQPYCFFRWKLLRHRAHRARGH